MAAARGSLVVQDTSARAFVVFSGSFEPVYGFSLARKPCKNVRKRAETCQNVSKARQDVLKCAPKKLEAVWWDTATSEGEQVENRGEKSPILVRSGDKRNEGVGRRLRSSLAASCANRASDPCRSDLAAHVGQSLASQS